MESQPTTSWKYLAPKPKSAYRQLFVKDRRISARTLYGCFMSEEEPQTIEQIAENYRLPIEAVKEAIAYCEANPPEIQRDYEMETATMKARGMLSPDYRGQPKILTNEERAELRRRFP